MKNSNIKLNYTQEVAENKKDCIWYGGDIVSIPYKDCTIVLSAEGDVRGAIYKDGEHLVAFKDKSNRGNFDAIMSSYLPNVDTDEKLYKILNSDLTEDDIKENKLTAIVLDNNNWLGVFIYKNNTHINDYTIDFTDDIDEAIKSVVSEIEYIYNEYCC